MKAEVLESVLEGDAVCRFALTHVEGSI